MSKQLTKAHEAAAAAKAKAASLRAKAENAALTAEERAALKAEADADDASAKEAELASSQDDEDAVTDASLNVIDPEIPAGDVDAQVKGNVPQNPKPALGLTETEQTVRMVIKRSDGPDSVADVHPDMVGDYARAGWMKSE